MAELLGSLAARIKGIYTRICEILANLGLRDEEQSNRMSNASDNDNEIVGSIFGDNKVDTDDASISVASSDGRMQTTLTNLPAELHLKIFDILDENASTCLGLTCKLFYGIHWAKHGIVDLNEYHNSLWLYELLGTYMAPRVPSVVRRNRQVDFVFKTKEPEDEHQENGKEKWRRWLGRTPEGGYSRFLK